MLDILGREVHRGDIVAFGSVNGGTIRYSNTRLGIINNVLGHKTHLKDSSTYNKIFKDALVNPTNSPYMPANIDTIAKVTFYPIYLSDKYLSDPIVNTKIHLNGKPKRGIVLTTTFLKVNIEDLTGEWLEAYTEARKAFRI